jgi:hypothetical protein
MSVHLAPISSVAAFNPSPPKGSLAIDDEIAFVPMAAVSEDGSMHEKPAVARGDVSTPETSPLAYPLDTHTH